GKNDEAIQRRRDVKVFKEHVARLNHERDAAEARMKEILQQLPNIPHESVPDGKDESANVEIRRRGTKPEFDFEPKEHVDLGTSLGILDLERATKIAGTRFAILNGVGASLSLRLVN